MFLESDIKDSFKNDEALELKVKEITKDLKDGKYDISNFVESIGFALTSSAIEDRVNGTRLLSAVLNGIPEDALSDGQVKFIVDFYCDRIKDHHNVYPHIINGLLSIIQMKNLPEGSVTKIYVAFFQNLACQSQIRSDREKIFKIFKITSEKNSKELIKMGGDFLYGVINAIDGERDPRNLEFIFNFMPEFINKYPLLHLAEEMFEIFACYFPIDFNPSKTDPSSITRDNLANSLCNCLVASSEFIKFAVPLALEKLESDLITAKLDSMELLERISKKFPIKLIEPHFEEIWNTLKGEIYPGSDNQEIIAKGLKTLKSILENACNDTNISKSFQTTVLGTILCHLSDVTHRMFAPSKSIALVCIVGDPIFATDKVLNCLILKLKSDDCDDEQKCKILSTISNIMNIISSKKCFKEVGQDVLSLLETELMKLVVCGTHNNELIVILFNCVTDAFEIFSLESRTLIYKSLLNIMTICNLNFGQNLKKIAQLFPIEIKDLLINPLMQQFNSLTPEVKEHLYLNLKPLVEFDELRLIILQLIIDNTINSEHINEKQAALNALKAVIDDQSEENTIIKELLHDFKILETLCNYTKKHSELSIEILEEISSVLNIFVRKLSLNDQKLVLDNNLPKMNLNLTTDLFITKGILGFMHESVSTDAYFDSLLQDLTTLALEKDDPILCNACHHLICTLLNKAEENENNRSSLKKVLYKLKEEIKKENEKAVKILSWIAKGLTVRGHPDAAEIVETLSELLNHPTLYKSACLAFEIISIEYPQLHLPVIKFLYKQKLFHIILNKIGKYLLDYSENHMNAFVFILKMTPHKVLKLNIEKVGPILFKCLEIKKVSTVLIALQINKKFLDEKDEYFRIHFNYLIPQYLKLSEYKDSMEVRIFSLKCIETIGQYPPYTLLPYKMDVILHLASALDDKKRLVRSAAVSARNLWFLIGSPTGGE
ncbi:MMS19 nucleotide excision repair protein isoform X2 [Condylostylus longicornis]|uniref:MMS19 nucleotide excision repair protein isoform X2 n=1 Tax=Condylostylus longicornis TaxID=2530218 RepID=UPI00244E586D|nr:MMS19 nucleotide excision repair protein isoform X2 [Condylostylus longicornis]